MTNTARSTAVVTSPKATRYMKQLCKHFQHKIPAEFDDTTGKITFKIGTCHMKSDGENLTLDAVATLKEDLPRLQDVISSHLVRFAFREDELAVVWQ